MQIQSEQKETRYTNQEICREVCAFRVDHIIVRRMSKLARNKGEGGGGARFWFSSLTASSAIERYSQAVNLVPNDPTPLGNLSAAQYEIGEYNQCIQTAEKALDVLDATEDPSSAAQDKLKHRITKAKAHDVPWSANDQVDQVDRRLRLIEALPRYRPYM